MDKYFEPFFSNEDKSKDSFGLGLYIVHNILKANGYTLEYEFENGINRFICKKGFIIIYDIAIIGAGASVDACFKFR